MLPLSFLKSHSLLINEGLHLINPSTSQFYRAEFSPVRLAHGVLCPVSESRDSFKDTLWLAAFLDQLWLVTVCSCRRLVPAEVRTLSIQAALVTPPQAVSL